MKKLLSLFLVPLFVLGFIVPALASGNGVPQNGNATVYNYDQTTHDLLILDNTFPVYFLINLNDSDCPDFTVGQNLEVKYVEGRNELQSLKQVDTNLVCHPVHPASQIQGDFRRLISVDAQHNTLRTLDEGGNTHEIQHGPGCQNASRYLNQEVFFGTGWQENVLFLPNNGGQCDIISSRLVQ